MIMTKIKKITNNIQIINTYIKLVVTRKKGFATSARLVRFVRAWRRVTPVACCSLAYVHI